MAIEIAVSPIGEIVIDAMLFANQLLKLGERYGEVFGGVEMGAKINPLWLGICDQRQVDSSFRILRIL